MFGATEEREAPPAGQRASWPFWLLGTGIFVMLLSANLPTPLYSVYRERFGFSGAVLTLIFATYAIVLVPSLLVFGQLSDSIGRRRVIALGLAVATVAMVLFALARGTGWLFAARAAQGLAVGVITGTATAALVEHEPDGNQGRAALAATLGQAGGGAAGPVLAGVLAEWAPAPRVLCYLVGAALTAVVAVATLRVPEPPVPGGRWRPQWPSVPRERRSEFARAGLTGGAVWAVGALFLSVVPTYAGTVLKTHDLALLGAVTAVMLGTACVAQVVSLRAGLRSATGQLIGLLVLIAGLIALVGAFPPRSLPLLLIAAVLAGTGLGLGFIGAQTQVNHLAPQQRRGEVTAAFITCVYLGVTVAAVSVGLLSDVLSLFAGVSVVSVGIIAVAAATAVWHAKGYRHA
ncbi:MFS transporter [Rugosimonospora africana]|uniref:Putative multi-drug efflux transporter n=1 Tax=Rugosimonospora africana TaxID=556532 RepID=A0A8J3VVA1_9ACTN|nr:MFS transporter [Rugosimonospora africana]GIH20065.1 putative multi-drug efflux transporter [Rugosimonospora africana]